LTLGFTTFLPNDTVLRSSILKCQRPFSSSREETLGRRKVLKLRIETSLWIDI
jgi:hypothetical protein